MIFAQSSLERSIRFRFQPLVQPFIGEKGWALKVDSRAIDMLSPVDGKVIAINQEVINAPGTIHQDPYRSWLMKVETRRFSVDKRQLL